MSIDRAEWHAAEDELAGYLSGDSPPVLAASIETHLLSCAECRNRLSSLAGDTERANAWDRLTDAIDRPSHTVLGRLTGGHLLARSSIATPTMVRAGMVAVALVGLVPMVMALVVGEAGLVALLVLAPLAPVAAVAIAYRDWSDPAGEITLATPSAGLRLVAMRALAVTLATLPLALAALWMIDTGIDDVPIGMAVAWCLPGLALAALVLLAGTTRFDPMRVAIASSVGWGLAVTTAATARRSLQLEIVVDFIASPAMQSFSLAVALAALLLTVVRRDAVSYRSVA